MCGNFRISSSLKYKFALSFLHNRGKTLLSTASSCLFLEYFFNLSCFQPSNNLLDDLTITTGKIVEKTPVVDKRTTSERGMT